MATADVNPLEDFFQLAKKLIIAVNTVFPECEKTLGAMEKMEVIDQSNMTTMKEMLVRQWYETVKPYMDQCTKKNDNALLRANIPVLDQLDIRSKWNHPEFSQESKDVMWTYINNLNYWACLYCEADTEQVQGLAAAATRLAETANIEISEDGKLSFNIQAFQELVTNPGNQGDINTLMQTAAPMPSGLLGGEGGSGGLQALLQSQMGNFASMLGGLGTGGQQSDT